MFKESSMTLITNDIINHLKMPPTLHVLGALYMIVILFYIISHISHFKYITSELFKFIIKKYLAVIILAILIIGIINFIDIPVRQWCITHQNPTIYLIYDFISSLGEGFIVIGFLITLCLILEFFNE